MYVRKLVEAVARKFKTAITVDELGSAASQAIAANVDGDTNDRVIIDAGGKITWGSGSATGDTTLYRSAADTLKTDDAFTATSLAVTGQFTLPTADGTANQVLKTNGSGTVSWTSIATSSDTAPSSPSAGDLWYETDTGNFYIYYDSFWIEIGNSGVVSMTTSDTPPSSPSDGDLWFETDTGKTFVYYADGTSSQWIEVGAASAAASGADGSVQFSSGGTFASDNSNLYWDDANNRLGIGTSTPSETLSIVTASAAYIKQENGTATTYLGPDSSNTGLFGTSTAHDVRFITSNTERVRIDSSGNVGIGTSSPETPLSIVTTNKLGATFTGTTDGEGLRVDQSNYTSGNYVSLVEGSYQDDQTEPHVRIGAQFTASGSYLSFGTSNSYGSGITNEALTIDYSGKVGIGTTSPTAYSTQVLHLHGTDSAALRVTNNTTGATNNDGLDLAVSGSTAYIIQREAADLRIATGGSDRIIINGSGHTFITNKVQTGQSSFTQEPWAQSTIALGNYGYIGTEGSYGLSLAWNWERGTDSGFHSLGVNSYTSACAMHMRNDGIRFQYESSWGATAEPAIHTIMGATELLVYKDLRLYESAPIITLQDSNSTGASNAEILFRDQASTVLGRVAMNGNDDLSIRAETSASILFFWAQGNWRFYMTSVQFLPYVDNAYDLGATGKRFDDVYATNGTIQTSDVRDKTDIVDIDYGLDFVNSLRPVTYRWDDRSGYVGTRTHMGFVAQEVSTALGDDAAGRALWVDSPAGEYKNADTGEYEPGVERQSLRYEEMIAPMVKAIQELTVRIEALEAN